MRIYTHARVNVRLLQKSPQELNIELPGGFSYSTATVTANMFRQTTIVECSAVFVMAGVEGLEPSRTVLETGMLPLHHTPKERLFNYRHGVLETTALPAELYPLI